MDGKQFTNVTLYRGGNDIVLKDNVFKLAINVDAYFLEDYIAQKFAPISITTPTHSQNAIQTWFFPITGASYRTLAVQAGSGQDAHGQPRSAVRRWSGRRLRLQPTVNINAGGY
ncbi:MAG: hypothetical protein R3C68_09025 [Myxococcota bacterium]